MRTAIREGGQTSVVGGWSGELLGNWFMVAIMLDAADGLDSIDSELRN